jgi:hypothetical protein
LPAGQGATIESRDRSGLELRGGASNGGKTRGGIFSSRNIDTFRRVRLPVERPITLWRGGDQCHFSDKELPHAFVGRRAKFRNEISRPAKARRNLDRWLPILRHLCRNCGIRPDAKIADFAATPDPRLENFDMGGQIGNAGASCQTMGERR